MKTICIFSPFSQLDSTKLIPTSGTQHIKKTSFALLLSKSMYNNQLLEKIRLGFMIYLFEL